MRLPATCVVLCLLGIGLFVTTAAQTTPVQVGDMACILNTTSNIMTATMVIYKKTAKVTRAFFTKLDSYDTVYDQTGCEWTGTGTDTDPFKAEVEINSTSNMPPTGKNSCGYKILDAQKQIYQWTVYNQQTYELGRGEDLVFIYECSTFTPTSISVTVKLNTKDKEGNAVRVKPENQLSILERAGSSSVFNQVVTDSVSVAQDIKLRVQSKVKRFRQDQIDHYGVYVFSCDYRTSVTANPIPFITRNGCPNNAFSDLGGGFKFARFSTATSAEHWFQTETDEFKLVPSTPQSDHYLLRCYLHYCYGSEGTDDKCSDYCNSNVRRRRSINDTEESVTIRVNINNDIYIGSGNEKQTVVDEQAVIIVIVAVITAILLVAIFAVLLICCCRRRRHQEKEWTDTSTTDSSKHLSAYPPAYQFRNPKF